MKKFDIKKIGIILAILVVVVLAIVLLGKSLKGNVDDATLKEYEKVISLDLFQNVSDEIDEDTKKYINESFDMLLNPNLF